MWLTETKSDAEMVGLSYPLEWYDIKAIFVSYWFHYTFRPYFRSQIYVESSSWILSI